MARGCIVKRGKSYAIKYRVDGKQKWKTIGPSKKEAERALVELMRRIHRAEYQEAEEIAFKDFAQKWLEDHAKPRVRIATFEGYRDMLKLHLVPYFGDQKLQKISAHSVEKYLSDKRKEGKLSPRTIGYHLFMLKTMFKRAIIWGYLYANPAQYIERPRAETKKMDFLTVEELQLFLKNVSPKFFPFFLTTVLTGMRRGELFALKWGDINWVTGQIHVRRAYVRERFQEPKSRAGTRAIVMPPILVKVLKRHKLSSPASDLNLVFPNEEGNPLNGGNIYNREFLPALRRAGLCKIRFHDLRHTYASLLIAQGENLKFIQQQLGHSSAQMTLDRYGHLMPQVQHGAGERLQNTVFKNFGSNLVAKDPFGEYGLLIDCLDHPDLPAKIKVSRAGIEPATPGLKVPPELGCYCFC